MRIVLRPASDADVTAAVAEAARRVGLESSESHPAYASPWRREGLTAAVGGVAGEQETRGYAVPSRRRVRGAIRA